MPRARRKILRVGVVHGGTVVDECLVREARPVRIGTSPRNTIAISQPGVPESSVVLSPRGSRWVLRFRAGAQGRIEGPNGVADLGALVALGATGRRGATCSIAVRDDQRGRLVLGEVTVLWQFVTPPEEPARPVLPREARGKRLARLDGLFVSVLAASFLLHSGAYLALASTDLPKEVTLDEIPDRYAKVLVPDRRPDPLRKREEREPQLAARRRERRDAEDSKQQDALEPPARKAERAAAVARAVRSRGILKVLGALGPGASGGAVADVFGGEAAADVAGALSAAGGVAVAADPAPAAIPKGAGEARAAGIGALATSGGARVAYGPKKEIRVAAARAPDVRPAATVAAEAPELDSSDIDAGKLGAFIRARMGLVKACYENALKRNPGLRGRIAIRFTILETGALADVVTTANGVGSAEVAACIVGTMRSWRTHFRPSGPVTVEYPFVFQPVN